MAVRIILLVLMGFGTTMSLFAQDSKYEMLIPFDDEQFKGRLKEFNLLELDSLQIIQGSIVLKDKNKYSMRWFEVHEEDMAQMPNMSIKKDIHYTMQIKKYDLQYPYKNTPKKDNLLNNRELLKPLRKPEE
ncbi:MAG: hypothetical protein KAI99_19680 [Cyclobacteriaceae bacterium]|nr:hypothetical protein [Cyclobacteriaceae bacterium]